MCLFHLLKVEGESCFVQASIVDIVGLKCHILTMLFFIGMLVGVLSHDFLLVIKVFVFPLYWWGFFCCCHFAYISFSFLS